MRGGVPSTPHSVVGVLDELIVSKSPAQRSSCTVYRPASLDRLETTEYIFLLEKYVCPLSWSVHCNFIGDGKCKEKGVGVHPPPSSAWSNFTLMMECTPESSRCYSVYSVAETVSL